MILSPNDPGTLIVAANRVFVSHDRGDSWTVISPDLTTQANRDTIVTMGLKGSDIHISRDDGVSQWPDDRLARRVAEAGGRVLHGHRRRSRARVARRGKTWQNITKNIPGFPAGDAFVSEVVPSAFDAATVYVTVDNHRLNDYAPYMWVSTDFGATFRSIVGNLTGENVRTLTEDQRNRDVLYIGTETGIFLSLDRGKSWQRLKANFPTVRVDEITLHPRDNAMLVATHGRALWILDHLEPIQEYAAAQSAANDASCSRFRRRSSGRRRTIATTSSGDTSTSSARIRRTTRSFSISSRSRFRISSFASPTPPERRCARSTFPAAKNQPGIQTVCWDMRGEGDHGAAWIRQRRPAVEVDAVAEAVVVVAAVLVAVAPRRFRAFRSRFPRRSTAMNPCAVEGAGGGGRGGGGGGGFGGGGGLGGPGPYVMPGTYTVALTSTARCSTRSRSRSCSTPT